MGFLRSLVLCFSKLSQGLVTKDKYELSQLSNRDSTD